LQHGKAPVDKRKVAYIKSVAAQCFLEDGILWRCLARHNAPTQMVLVVPASRVDELIHETHRALMAGHEGITKMKKHLLQSYFLPNMDKDIEACQRCHA